jgi:D-3-phosphoglycerate dehydrogenase
VDVLPRVVLADRLFMTPSAMKILESDTEVIWAPNNDEEFLLKVRDAAVIVAEYHRITDHVMDAAVKSLRGIVAYGVGYDHIDVQAATGRGLYVANCRGANSEAVAELAVTLMLGVSRGTHIGDRFVRDGLWERNKSLSDMKGRELAGKALGLVGMGEIGRRVVRICKGFDMRIIVFDPYLSRDQIRQAGAEPADLTTVMKEADYVSIHAPLTSETRGLIGETEFALMKPSAYLINTARGAIIVEKALIDALRNRRIAGAGLDVFPAEPLSASSPLVSLDNVILSPHIGGLTEEAIAEMSRVTAEESVRIAQGRVPINLINRNDLAAKGIAVS